MNSMSPRIDFSQGIDSVDTTYVVPKSEKIRALCLVASTELHPPARQVFTRRGFLLYGLLIDLLKGKNASKICLLTHTVY